MRAMKLPVKLSKIGQTKLEASLKTFVSIPVPDKESPQDWVKHFGTEWPKGHFEKPEFHEVMIEGLKVLARKVVVQELVRKYKAEHPSDKVAGKKTEVTFEAIK